MLNIFKLFYKSKGNNSITNVPTQYNYPICDIEANNFEELGRQATDKILELGIDIGEFEVDILNRGEDYNNRVVNGTGKLQQKNIFTNHTGKY